MNQSENAYTALAMASLRHYLETGKTLKTPENLPAEMLSRKASTFVTLHKFGQLRGCIGTISPIRRSIAEEIIHNAISSGTADPRFPAVKINELADLTISVDVLAEPEPIQSSDQLDIKRYGVIVSSGFRRGLLLPNLDGISSVAEQVAIARRKAGISADEPVQLERFEVVRYE